MAPITTGTRSRRTSYSWSSDSGAIRPLSQWQEVEGISDRVDDYTSDECSYDRKRSRDNQLKGNSMSDLSDMSETDSSVRRPQLRPIKVNYESDSCLTPRSRRTLPRTPTGAIESWPSVQTQTKPALDTIYSPTHEILHPMQTLLLEKLLCEKSAQMNGVAVSSTKVTPDSNTPPQGELKQSRVSVDGHKTLQPDTKPDEFESYKLPKPQSNRFKFESYTPPEPHQNAKCNGGGEKLELTSSKAQGSPKGDSLDVESAEASMANIVAIIMDAEKKPSFSALDWAIKSVVQPGDEIIILGVLKRVTSPMGCKVVATTDLSVGVNDEVLQKEVNRATSFFEHKLSDSGRRAECEKKNVKLTVWIAPGARARTVIVRELASLKATYAIFDKRAMRSHRYYGKHLSCYAVRMRRNGRSTKAITTVSCQKALIGKSSSVQTSNTSPTSPNHHSRFESPAFWRRFRNLGSSRNLTQTSISSPSSSASQSSDTISPSAISAVDHLDSFISEMQDFSISLDQSKQFNLSDERTKSELALQSRIMADAFSHKKTMDAHRIRHRPISVSVPPICAT